MGWRGCKKLPSKRKEMKTAPGSLRDVGKLQTMTNIQECIKTNYLK